MPGDERENAGGESDSTAPRLSVDHLTQAFAQLMGDDSAQTDAPSTSTTSTDAPSNAESPAPAPAGADEDDDTAGIVPEQVLEAILFVGHPQNEPLTSRRIASFLRGVSPQEVDEMIVELNQRYADQQAAYEVVSEGAGYRMTLRPEFTRLREAFYGKVREAKLTQAAVDCLAIVAYHQPIERDLVEKLRGQNSGSLLSQLVRRELLQVEVTNERPRKKLYRTTDRFLDLFGLDCLADLPSHDDF
ncbi:MAG: SMC-Scp complex subunit ScpB [Planctomycetales bacterium]|nr:SMC-Scp complex subunit ScpB [Planctomycetales bacterium]